MKVECYFRADNLVAALTDLELSSVLHNRLPLRSLKIFFTWSKPVVFFCVFMEDPWSLMNIDLLHQDTSVLINSNLPRVACWLMPLCKCWPIPILFVLIITLLLGWRVTTEDWWIHTCVARCQKHKHIQRVLDYCIGSQLSVTFRSRLWCSQSCN